MDSDRQWMLRRLELGSWFGGLPRDLRHEIVERSREHRFRKHQLIQSEGSTSYGLGAVLEGEVSAMRWADDAQPTLITIGGPGFWFGELAALTGIPAVVSIEAQTEVRVMVLPQNQLEQMISADPSTYRHFAALAFERYARAIRWVSEVNGLNPECVLRCRLADLVEQRLEEDRTAEPEVALSQGELGALVGLSRQTTNQLLKRLEQRGWIEVSFRSIRVTDLAALRGGQEPAGRAMLWAAGAQEGQLQTSRSLQI